MFPGLGLIAVGLLWFMRAPVNGNYITDIFPVMVVFGTGAGVCFPALMGLAMSGATPSDAGLASGLVNTTAQVGGALGLAVLATLSASHSSKLIASGHSSAAALTSGYHLAFGIGAALVGCAIAVAAIVVAAPAQMPTAHQSETQTDGGARAYSEAS
jgi:hypothetical protein